MTHKKSGEESLASDEKGNLTVDDVEIAPVQMCPDGRMSVANAARYLGLAKKTLDMWRSASQGPAFTKISNRVFYFKQVLDEWIDRQGSCVSTAQARILKQMEENNPTPSHR